MVVGATETARDLVIRGPDAEQAGLALDRSNNPFYIYDVSGNAVAVLEMAFEALTTVRKLEASIEVLPDRVPHRRRVDLAIEAGAGVGIVDFCGMWAVALGDIPRDRALPILGERVPDGPDAGRWRRIRIAVRDGEPSLKGSRRTPAPCAFERANAEAEFRLADDFDFGVP
jgi:hypothetical protein